MVGDVACRTTSTRRSDHQRQRFYEERKKRTSPWGVISLTWRTLPHKTPGGVKQTAQRPLTLGGSFPLLGVPYRIKSLVVLNKQPCAMGTQRSRPQAYSINNISPRSPIRKARSEQFVFFYSNFLVSPEYGTSVRRCRDRFRHASCTVDRTTASIDELPHDDGTPFTA